MKFKIVRSRDQHYDRYDDTEKVGYILYADTGLNEKWEYIKAFNSYDKAEEYAKLYADDFSVQELEF